MFGTDTPARTRPEWPRQCRRARSTLTASTIYRRPSEGKEARVLSASLSFFLVRWLASSRNETCCSTHFCATPGPRQGETIITSDGRAHCYNRVRFPSIALLYHLVDHSRQASSFARLFFTEEPKRVCATNYRGLSGVCEEVRFILLLLSVQRSSENLKRKWS